MASLGPAKKQKLFKERFVLLSFACVLGVSIKAGYRRSTAENKYDINRKSKYSNNDDH